MGRELSCFVDGNNVSRHLLCSICHGVLEAPVQTACEHLFCEEELVEWMCHGNRCPVCAAELVAEEVVRAPRAIVGLIEDLECHCAYAIHGCPWTGDSAAARRHAPSCEFAPMAAAINGTWMRRRNGLRAWAEEGGSYRVPGALCQRVPT